MTIWSYCPRCNAIYDEFELKCSGCNLSVKDIEYVKDRLLNNEVVAPLVDPVNRVLWLPFA